MNVAVAAVVFAIATPARAVAAETPLYSIAACTTGSSAEPVLLIHGLRSSAAAVGESLAPALRQAGRCVYAVDYPSAQDIPTSVDYLASVIAKILTVNHTRAVSLVGHSLGGVIARALSVRYGESSANPIRTVVTLASPQFGLDRGAFGRIAKNLPAGVGDALMGGPAGRQLLADSEFLRTLNAGSLVAPNVTYTMVASRFDRLTGATSDFVFASNVTNVTLQDGCPQDHASHNGVLGDPRAIDYVVHALELRPTAIRCEPYSK